MKRSISRDFSIVRRSERQFPISNQRVALGKGITLFKNYMSSFRFNAYILFIGSVTGTVRKDPSISAFGIENIKDSAIELIKAGLCEEGVSKEYIDDAKDY